MSISSATAPMRSHAPNPSAVLGSPSAPSAPSLASLRAEIDAIDAELVSLIRRRQRCAQHVGKTKRSSTAEQASLALRPHRERAVVARVSELGADLPDGLIQGVWRHLLSASLGAQSPVSLAVHARTHPVTVSAAAAARFAAPVINAPDHAAALAAAATGQTIAVIELTPGDSWWTALDDQGLTAFDIVHCGEGRPVALAVARIEGEDRRPVIQLVPEADYPARLHGGEPLQPIAHGGGYWLCAA